MNKYLITLKNSNDSEILRNHEDIWRYKNDLLNKIIKDSEKNILEEDNKNNIVDEYGFIKINSEGGNSTYDEAFPGLREKLLKDESLSNTYNDSKIMKVSNEENSDNNNIINIDELNNNLNEVNTEMETLKPLINILKKCQTDEEAAKTLQTLVKLSEKVEKISDWMSEHSLIVQIGAAGIATVPPMLAYKGILNTYSKFVLRPIEDLKGLNNHQVNKLILQNKRLLTRFNMITLPILGIAYVMSLNKFKFDINKTYINTEGSGLENKTSITKESFISIFILNKLDGIKKKIKSNKIISIIVFVTIISLIIIYNQDFYAILNILISDKYVKYFKYFGLLWLILWNIFHFIELCIYSLKSVNKFNNPKYLPTIVLNWLKNIDENIKLKLAPELITFYIKAIIFYSLITILYIVIFIM